MLKYMILYQKWLEKMLDHYKDIIKVRKKILGLDELYTYDLGAKTF